MLRKALPPRATAATAFRRLPPFRESVVPWLAAAARVALGAAVVVSASSSGHGSFDSFESSWTSVAGHLSHGCLLTIHYLCLCSAVCSYSAVQWRVRGNCGVCYTRVAAQPPLLLIVHSVLYVLWALYYLLRAALPPLSSIYYSSFSVSTLDMKWAVLFFSLLLSSDLKHFSSLSVSDSDICPVLHQSREVNDRFIKICLLAKLFYLSYDS